MSLYGAFDSTNHFSELATPLVTAEGVKTPAQRRALALANLMGAGFVAPVVFGSVTSSSQLTTTNVGTVTTSATTVAQEHGDGVVHITKLTLTAFAIGTSGDNANLALGAKIYTLPAGAIAVEDASIVGGITAAISVTTDTPEVGIGTTVASGANATLGTTTEDIVDGGAAGYVGGDTVAPDVAGTTFSKGMTATTPIMIKTSGGKSHDLFLNVADGWADVTAAGAVTFTGVITLKWRIVS
mgnify:FL=1